jgi:hypothetical protein
MTSVIKEGWTTFKSIFTGMGVTIRHFFRPARWSSGKAIRQY